MQRASLERRRTIRKWLRHLKRVESTEFLDARPRDLQPGRFRKGRVDWRCNRWRCPICRPAKMLGLPHLYVVRHDMSYREMLEELGLASMFRWRRPRRFAE